MFAIHSSSRYEIESAFAKDCSMITENVIARSVLVESPKRTIRVLDKFAVVLDGVIAHCEGIT